MQFFSFARFKMVVLIGFVFFCYIGYLQWSDIQHSESEYKSYAIQNREDKFEVVKSILSENYIKAKMKVQMLSERIITRVKREIPADKIRYYLDRLDDDNNPIIAIMAEESLKDENYVNVKNDGNDPWIGTLAGVISDYSADCSAAGRSRSWEVEYTLHANGKLAEVAVARIKQMTSPDIDSGRVDSPIFWEFKKKENDPNWVLQTEMTLRTLENVFLKYNGDIHSLETYEFAYPLYVYPKTDLAGRPLIDERGQWQGESSKPLILNAGFNLYDAIVSNTTHVQTMQRFDYNLEEAGNRLKSEMFWKYFALIATFLLFISTQLSTAHIVHIETKRMVDEEDQLAEKSEGDAKETT